MATRAEGRTSRIGVAEQRTHAGASLLELWNTEALRVRVSVPQRDAGGIDVGSTVGIKFSSAPSATWWTAVDQVGPAVNAERLDVLAALATKGSDRHSFAVKAGCAALHESRSGRARSAAPCSTGSPTTYAAIGCCKGATEVATELVAACAAPLTHAALLRLSGSSRCAKIRVGTGFSDRGCSCVRSISAESSA